MAVNLVFRIVGDNLNIEAMGHRIMNVEATSVVVAAPKRPSENMKGAKPPMRGFNVRAP